MSWTQSWRPRAIVIVTLLLPSVAAAQTAENGEAAGATSGEVGADSDGLAVDGSTTLESDGLNLRFGIGFALPGLSEDIDARYTGGGTLGIDAGLRLGDLIIGGAASYTGLPFDEFYLKDGADVPVPENANATAEGGTLRVYQLEAQARWIVYRGELQPYLLLSGGLAVTDADRLDVDVTVTDDQGVALTQSQSDNPKSETQPVLSLGVGAEDRQESFELYAQVRADIILADQISPVVMVTVGAGL